MWLLIAFIVLPLIEIALFIQVGGLIGLWPTLGIVLLTAVVGSWLVRTQGAAAIAELRGSFAELRDPTEPIAHGAMILLAGAFLIAPGFFTDTLGILLLLRPVRLAILRYMARHVRVERFSTGTPPRREPFRPDIDIIDGEFHEVSEDNTLPRRRSGWTQH